MREIKFRAYRKDKKKMYPPFSIWKINLFDYDYKSELIVMQYTGLKDKNGKEIYEGDIVQYYNSRQGEYLKHDVSFYKGSFGLDKFVWIDDDKHGLLDNIEVIGNIYENPESPKESE